MYSVRGNDQVSWDLREERKQNYFTMNFGTWTFPQNKCGTQQPTDTQISLMSSQKKMRQERNEKTE